MADEVSQTGDMASAVSAAFSAASTPDAAPAQSGAEHTPASVLETPSESANAAAGAPTDDDAPLTEGQAVPWQRFKKVNQSDQTRKQELEALGWAKGVNPQLAQSAIQLLTRAQQNPLAFTEELEAVRDHPVLGPQLRSWAARTLGFRNASRQTEMVDETMPEPDLLFEDGRKAYSAEAQAKRDQFLLKQFQSTLDERLNPLTEKGKQVDQIVAEKEYARISADAQVTAKTEIDQLREQYPQFDAHKKDVAAEMEANPRFTLAQAWASVFVKKVGPQLAGQSAAAVSRKVAAGSGSANPARPSGATKAHPVGFKAALEEAFGVTNA